MPRLLKRCLLVYIPGTLCMYVCIITTIYFMYHKTNDYRYIPDRKIRTKLFNATNCHLNQSSNINCTYDEVLTNTNSLEKWEDAKPVNFSAAGIVDGSYAPKHCNTVFSVAILVTYRHRKSQLKMFLPYMHNFLRKQNIHYKIYVIEQRDEKPWNKGLLYNIGAKQALADRFPCLILHDVDLLPLDESNLYACTIYPRHMSACVDKFNYELPYASLVGGVLAITTDQFVALNGFSNRFYGWGAEDDDFAARIATHRLNLFRFPPSMSRYTMLRHPQERENPDRLRILEENRGRSDEGLTSVRFTSVKLKQLQLYTWIRVVT